MRKSALLALAFLGIVGCDSMGPVDFDSLSHDPEALVGTWDLVGEWSYGRTGSRDEDDPRELGWHETWTFSADGTAELVIDSETYSRAVPSTYEIVERAGRRPFLLIGSESAEGGWGYWFGIDGDRLVLLDRQIADSPEQVYRRRSR